MMSRCKFALAIGMLAVTAASQAQNNPFAKGPDPTLASIQVDGPFAVSTQTVARAGAFGGATVYSPNAAGQYALVVLCPGFIEMQRSVTGLGRRLATHGFVVATIDTTTPTDLPPRRGTQR